MTSFSNLTMRVIGGSFVFRVKRGVQFRMRKCKKTSVNYCGILRSVLQDLYLANRQAQNPARFHLGRKSARSLIFLTELIFPPEAVLACFGRFAINHAKSIWDAFQNHLKLFWKMDAFLSNSHVVTTETS